jgi:hypothetical protein
VVLVPLALIAPLTAAAGGRSVHYDASGKRAEFKATLDRHGRKLDYEMTYHGSCDAPGIEDYGAYGTSSTPGEHPLRLGAHGRFHMHHHYRAYYTGTIINVRFAGRLGRKGGAGTFSMKTTNDGDGGQVVHCATGRVHWTARRGPAT